jgi:hypothetical protein
MVIVLSQIVWAGRGSFRLLFVRVGWTGNLVECAGDAKA